MSRSNSPPPGTTDREKVLEQDGLDGVTRASSDNLPSALEVSARPRVPSGPDMMPNPSSAYAKAEGHNRVVAHYKQRGTLDVAGAAYYEPKDMEKYQDATYVGLSYQVSSVSLINSVTESFRVVLDLNMMYKIDDSDKDQYEAYRSQGSVSFQDIVDKGKVRVKPPVFEYRNAIETPEESQGRVTEIKRCYDHRSSQWAWYVTLYLQVRAECYEEFEMQRFPFARNSLQVVIQCQMQARNFLLVPYNSRSALPHYFWNEREKTVQECFKRGNSLKVAKTVGNWEIEAHHAFFMPDELSPPMPSGNKFSTCIISIQCKQPAHFFIYNTTVVIVCLPLLSMLCVVEDVDAVADRMSIVLTLLLTMSTYKIVIADWIPQKDYLTFMDWYIITGFVLILFIAGWVMLTAFLSINEVVPGAKAFLDNIEMILMGTLAVIWLVAHVYVLGTWESWYLSWETLLAAENTRLREINDSVVNEREQMAGVKLLSCPEPDLPAPKPQKDE